MNIVYDYVKSKLSVVTVYSRRDVNSEAVNREMMMNRAREKGRQTESVKYKHDKREEDKKCEN